MANLQIKDLPDDLHAELRRRAAAEGGTVRAYVLDLIRRELDHPSPQEWLARLEGLERAKGDAAAAELVRDGRSERGSHARGR